MKKKDIVSIIQNTATFTNPIIELEQYCIDASSAVDLIYFAGFEFNDIKNHIIFDLGAGTGRLSIASALFGAHSVLSVDIDWSTLLILRENIINLELDHIIFPVCSDLNNFEVSEFFLENNKNITSVMNPPFGVKTRAADRIFLQKAFSFSNVVYSIHLAGEKNRKFISHFIKESSWKIDNIIAFNMFLERSYPFHNQKVKKIKVDIYRFIKK
ncbi:MAG: METTL5 family protein [Promethearchaeota archaeon]